MEPSDHRAIGARSDLFHFQDEAPGMAFWHPRGWTLFRLVERQIRKRLEEDGYLEVKTPPMLGEALWRRSGHWDMFRKHMYAAGSSEPGKEAAEFALKPVSCPAHVQIFNSRVRSWRDLPLRLAEFGCCCRNEPRGALQGLMRLRAFTQDDAHIFCREEDLEEEVARFVRLLKRLYADFGFADRLGPVGFSTRPDLRAGDDALWDRAEAALKGAAEAAGLALVLQPGEGAFYGPKLEFALEDAEGRSWQCGTIQADFVLPARLGAEYRAADDGRAVPVMLHRAVLGSLERFIAILLEHHKGRPPLWLAPTQIVVASISSEQDAAARALHEKFLAAGLRSLLDVDGGTIAGKIRRAETLGVPVAAAVGRREAEAGTAALRWAGGRREVFAEADAIQHLAAAGTPP